MTCRFSDFQIGYAQASLQTLNRLWATVENDPEAFAGDAGTFLSNVMRELEQSITRAGFTLDTGPDDRLVIREFMEDME